MRLSIGVKIMAGYVFALLALVIIGGVAYSRSASMLETAGWVTHSHKVIDLISRELSLLQDAETGQRGYLLVGEERYKEPYINALKAMGNNLQELRKMTEDNPTQQKRWKTLETLVQVKSAELAETISLRSDTLNGFEAALAVVRTDKGRQAMSDIRKLIAEARADEETLLQKRDAEAIAAYKSLMMTVVIGTAISVIVLMALGLFITRGITARVGKAMQMLLSMSQGNLKTRLEMQPTDEIGIMAGAMDKLADIVQSMSVEANLLTKAAVDGKLSTRGNSDKFEGDFRKIVQGVNDTLDAVIGPLNMAAAIVDRIAKDDIPQPITDSYNGDFDVLKKNLNKMIENLRGLNKELQSGFRVLASSSSEILATVSQVSSGAAETVAAVSETSITAEEVRQTAHLSNQKAKGVEESALRTSAVSETGRTAVTEAIEGMNHIREQMEEIAESVVRLSEQSQAIGEIIATVNDLAEQSNLLAVNAAIEATRAGEFGKGFAVVAHEVKGLAEQSRQATTQVRTILMEVQKATSSAVMATEQGTKAVAAGVKQATDAGESIRALTGSVGEAAQAATQIAASSQQQLVGMDQIAAAIANIRKATTQNLAGTKQLEASAQDLQELGVRLKDLVERQRVAG